MTTVFKAPAHFDALEVKTLRAQFEKLAAANDDVVIDLARTEVVDGSGIGAMVFAFKRLAVNGRRLTIRNVSGQPLDLLNASGLLRTLGAKERPAGVLRSLIQAIRRQSLAAAPATAAPVESRVATAERTKGAA